MRNKANIRIQISIILLLVCLLSCSNKSNYTFNNFLISFPKDFNLKEIHNNYHYEETDFIKNYTIVGDEEKNVYIGIFEYDITDDNSQSYNYDLEDLREAINRGFQLRGRFQVYREYESDEKVVLRAPSYDDKGICLYSMAYHKDNRLQRIDVEIFEEDYEKYKDIIIEFLKNYKMN